jgi:hypothetical protein
VEDRRARIISRHPLILKDDVLTTICDPMDSAEDYRELIHRCDLQIWQILEVKERAENALTALEGGA